MTQYTYDDVGNLATRKDANLHQTTYGYDAANRLTSVTAPLNRVWSVLLRRKRQPDAGDRRERERDALRGATGRRAYGYDVLNRLTSIDYSDTTPDVDLRLRRER